MMYNPQGDASGRLTLAFPADCRKAGLNVWNEAGIAMKTAHSHGGSCPVDVLVLYGRATIVMLGLLPRPMTGRNRQ